MTQLEQAARAFADRVMNENRCAPDLEPTSRNLMYHALMLGYVTGVNDQIKFDAECIRREREAADAQPR